MQINITTDYAIRALLCLAVGNRPRNGVEIAESMKIPHSYLLTLMAKLKRAGFVSSTRGHSGGYALAKLPSNITLWDIISVMEGAPQLIRCLEADGYCSKFASGEDCPLRRVYGAVQKSFEDIFRGVTLEDLIKDLNPEDF
jgi:Rrf2 family protein